MNDVMSKLKRYYVYNDYEITNAINENMLFDIKIGKSYTYTRDKNKPIIHVETEIETIFDIRYISRINVPKPNEATLIKIAKTDPDAYVRKLVTEKITDEAALIEIAETDPTSDVREAAVAKITNPVALRKIAKTDPFPYVREAAKERLKALNYKS